MDFDSLPLRGRHGQLVQVVFFDCGRGLRGADLDPSGIQAGRSDGRSAHGSGIRQKVFGRLAMKLAVIGVPMLFSVAAFAQDPRGTISGRVVDRSDAVVVGAKVQVTNVQTQVSTAVQANPAGVFTAPFLIPGTYRVTAEMPGFKTASLENVELRVA